MPKHGRGKLLTGGKPGHKGGSGRPPKEWTQFCRDLVEDPEVQERTLATARSNERSQIGAVQLAASYAVGKPVERMIHSGSTERVLRVVYEPLPPLPDRREIPVATVRIVQAEP